MKDLKLNINITIITIFIALITLIISAILVLQIYFSKQLVQDVITKQISFISDKTKITLNNIKTNSYNNLSMIEMSSHLEEGMLNNPKSKLLKIFERVVLNNTYIYAIYAADDDGNFYELINLDIDESLRKQLGSSAEEKWLVVKINTNNENHKRERVEEFLNEELKLIRTTRRIATYDPRSRIWYKNAINSNELMKENKANDASSTLKEASIWQQQVIKNSKAIKTEPYLFSTLNSMGITYAKKVNKNNIVMAIDVSLKDFKKFLQKEDTFHNSKLFIFNNGSKKIISSNLSRLSQNNHIGNIDDVINNNLKSIIEDEKEYLVASKKISEEEEEYLVLYLLKDEVMKTYNEQILFSIYLSIILLVLLSPLLFYASKIIVNPISRLVLECDKIRNRKYADVIHTNTHIHELNILSNSILDMSSSIEQFQIEQITMIDSIVELMASAIDEKSEYTGGHGSRVPIITMMLAHEASKSKEGIFKDYSINNADEERELKIAALLHDCGKITTPEYVVDKATKLETIYNRIHEIRARFEIVYRDYEILHLKKIINGFNEEESLLMLKERQEKLMSDYAFIAKLNIGSEFTSTDDIEKLKEISKITWIRYFDNKIGLSYDEEARFDYDNNSNIENIIADKPSHVIKRKYFSRDEYADAGFKLDVPKNQYNFGELYNLSIVRGTLTDEERFKINEHIIMTIKMLNNIPFPKGLQRVPEYAGAHHETLIGTGYPKKLKKEDMSIPARIMAIADIFEALTAKDRPYKKAKTLSDSIKILSFMVKDQHIDKNLFELFLLSGIYKEYAYEYLDESQIDEVDIKKYLS